MSTTATADEDDEPTDPRRFPSPDRPGRCWPERGYDPDDLGQVADLASVGMTAPVVAQQHCGGLARRRGHRRPVRCPHQHPSPPRGL